MAKIPSGNPYEALDWDCFVSYARFGSKLSGGASNLSSGGIGVGFDFESGKYKNSGIRYKRFCPDGNYKCYEHPDTKVVWKDEQLPNWSQIREKLKIVCSHISSLDYLGFDVIITQDGFNFCEINTHPACDYEQILCGPVLKNEKAVKFFKNKGLFGIDTKEFYSAYIESQI